jgi:hypothetical protein
MKEWPTICRDTRPRVCVWDTDVRGGEIIDDTCMGHNIARSNFPTQSRKFRTIFPWGIACPFMQCLTYTFAVG